MNIEGLIEESGRLFGAIPFAYETGMSNSFFSPVLKSSISSFSMIPVEGENTLLPKL